MKYALINGILLDGTETMQPRPGLSILVNGDRIEAIVPAGTEGSDYERIDLAGGYVMPGLINLHVHLPASGKPTVKQKDNKKIVRLMTSNALLRAVTFQVCAGYAKTELLSGVTTLRSVGGIQAVDSCLRDKILSGKAVGPRILAGNMAVSVPGGHMAGSLAYEAASPEGAAALVRKIAEDKPDLIKLMITGGVLDAKSKGEPGELKMPPEVVKAACDQAHALGLPVAAHVESPQGVRVALEGGVDTIEHGAKPDEEILRLFKERHACHIATISPALPYAMFDRSVTGASETEQYNGRLVMDGIIDCAKACLERGIPVGLGTETGCPYITHYDMWREVYYFHKFCGVTNAFALHTATLGNARLVGLGEEIGSLEPGKCADLVVTGENPLEDLKARQPDEKPAFRDRVAIVGSEIDDPSLTKLIEGCGALIVSDRFCFGSTPGREVIELNDEEDVLRQICRHYMETSECARYISDEKVHQRRETADRLAREYKADGIIYEQMKYCDYWGFERALASYVLNTEYGWPVLSIDRVYNNGYSGQLRTRVQAFVESLEIKKIQRERGAK